MEGSKATALVEFLYPAPAPRTTWGIVKWWESRRLPYNLLVGGTGLVSWGAFHVLTSLPPSAVSLPSLWQGVVVYGVMANLCYFLGPAAEVVVHRLFKGELLPTGPGLYRMGLTFSVGLTLLPTLLATMDWAFRLLRWLF